MGMLRAPDPRLRFARKVASGAAAVLLLVVTLLAQWHEATTPHVRCAVHGEQTHAITHGTGQVGAPTIGGDQIANRADDIVAEHEHCGIVATAHALFARPAAPTLITDAAVPIAIAPPIAAAPIARATFRLAPKTSPPV